MEAPLTSYNMDITDFWKAGRIIIAGILIAPVAAETSTASSMAPHEEHATRHLGRTRYFEVREIASYIANHSSARETVLIWGPDTAVNELAQRKSPTPFNVADTLFLSAAERTRSRRLFVTEISEAPPKYVVVDCQPSWPTTAKNGYELLADFPAFQSFIRKFYYLDRNFGSYDLWALR